MFKELDIDQPYSPLPQSLEIRKSSIDGLGLFAAKDIPQGTELGITHIKHSSFQNGWIRTPLGGFYNHNDNPNCFITDHYLDDSTQVKILITLQDISVDMELTCRYSLWNIEALLAHLI